MKKIIIFILITVLMLLSCKNNSTNVDTDNNNGSNTGENNNNGNNGENNNDPTVTPEELEKYGIEIDSATTENIEKALNQYYQDKGEYKVIFKGNSTIQYTRLTSIASLLNDITLKNINVIVSFEHVNFQNNKLNERILQGNQDNSNIVKVILPDNITTIGRYAFSCVNLTNVNMPKNLKTIESAAFDKLKMEKLIFPDGLETIEGFAFSVCNMKTVVIPDSVTSIGEQAFESCKNLIELKLPNNIKTLETRVFSSCYALKSITIPASVIEIKESAFYYSTGLESIIFLSTTPPTIGQSAFSGTVLKTIYVPKGSKEQYEKLKGQAGIPDSIEIIEQQ
ncbi:leucine-rich repeat domain-containing protein [Brachyspira pilosicoli]|uniref:leucine-rich repeat domain-containing protein n=2 Tax=Brachyspira pilosicoli TaxID=52584 RepID=UPI002543C59D|nr:leucine-rich repeat domain-containing protein [Brachyspira pilosicoli]WIH81019.1 leucine-rich repeat domain-containing protein [Brachyspira pilosicoli]WIH87720.1 leucine-rich repeat domain-containing protein [Brachyspira pilosicoli]